MVKIGSVTAEIFLIWTNVARIIVTVTVGICSRCFQESFIKIGSVTAEILLTFSFCGWWWGGVGWFAK